MGAPVQESPDRVLDLHHHFLPREVFDRLLKEAGGRRRLDNEYLSMTLSEDLPDVPRHLQAMDEAGIDAALLSYSGVSVMGAEICRLLNDGYAEALREAPGRFLQAVHLSLHDPAAVAELERCMRDLQPVAVALPTSERGKELDDPSLLRLWQCIARTGLAVVLHPALLPQGASRDYALERTCARPHETSLAAVRVAYGVAPKVPGLRVVLPHLGGTCLFLRGRLAMFYDSQQPASTGSVPRTVREREEAGESAAFEAAWSCFWFDTAGSGAWAPAVRMALEAVDASRLVFGSDYPLEARSGRAMREMVEMIDGLPASGIDKAGIKGGNARKIFSGRSS